MKTRYWVAILVVVAIVVIGIVFFMCGYFPRSFFHGGKHRVVNQYEVFRDLLAIILTLLGLGGFTIYKLISKGLQAVVKKKVDEEVDYAIATFFLELSYECWRDYEVKGIFQSKEKNQLERAISQSEKALVRAGHLNIEQKDFKEILCLIKNTLAYHLAVRNCDEDAEKAISFARYAYDRRNDFDFDSCYWMETYGFVLIRMGTKEQKKEGREIIKELKDRRYLPKLLQDSMDGKYTKNLAIRRGWN